MNITYRRENIGDPTVLTITVDSNSPYWDELEKFSEYLRWKKMEDYGWPEIKEDGKI